MKLTTLPFRSMIAQMIIVLLALFIALAWFWSDINQFVINTKMNSWGLKLNAVILAIFLLGFARMALLLFSFKRENVFFNRLYEKLIDSINDPEIFLPKNSLARKRYHAIKTISSQNSPIEQSALALSVGAEQSARFTLVRYVHNILILCGVLGTMVSLSAALIGASQVLNVEVGVQMMGSVIGSMSTALTTTVTAIVLYMIYTYFHMRLQDVRTQTLTNLEQLTTIHILPRFPAANSNERLQLEMVNLATELQQSAKTVNLLQNQLITLGNKFQPALDSVQNDLANGRKEVSAIRKLVCQGFRLEDTGEQTNFKDQADTNTNRMNSLL